MHVGRPKNWNSLLQALRFRNVTVLTISAGTSRLITSSKPFHTPRYRPIPPCASDSAFADIVRVIDFINLLTYLLMWCFPTFCFRFFTIHHVHYLTQNFDFTLSSNHRYLCRRYATFLVFLST